MKILVIHQFYLAPGEPGGSRFNEFAAAWEAAGHQVTVIAGSLNYATGITQAGAKGRWTSQLDEAGVNVWRCYMPATYNNSYLGRMWSFLGFTLSSITAVFRAGRPDVVIATSPPLTTGPTGWLAAHWYRCPWVFEVRDLWPESAITTGVLSSGSPLTRLLYAIERFSCRKANVVNVLTPAFAEDLISRGLVGRDKVVFVPNGADLDLFVPGERSNAVRARHGWDDKFVALYAGAHGRANALKQLVEAAEALREREDLVIATVGDGPERERWQQEARSRGLTNIQFLGAVAKAEMPAYVRACDVGLAVLQNNPTFRTVYPNKVFDYMACERPTILAIDGVARQLVCDQAGAGVFVQPEDGDAIAGVIADLAADPGRCRKMGASGRAWVTANASRAVLAGRYLDILSSLADAS